MIVHVESVLGFDWRAHTAYLEGHPHLSRMLALSYHSSGPQIALVVIVLASTRRISRLWAFVRLFSVALACVVVLSAVLPAVGPYVFYAVDPSTPNGLETIGALWHLEPLINLRSSTMQVIALSEMRGLATFPSFHVSLALITAWALASVRYLGLVILSLNMAVIVATLSAGGHYLPDVLGGATIGLMLLMPRIAAWHIRTYTAFTRASANSRTDFIYIPRARFSLMTRRPERATSPHTRSSHGAGLARYSTGISEAKQIQS
ncbi:phosphatase PAP2 family protein [Methylobacterium frigidaeris]|nr:phosphatase PAP2 family protein [Methylobacterium frigidaeris]